MNQIAIIEKMTPAEIYSANTIDEILGKIKEEVSLQKLDVTTPLGRKEIASLAHKVARSKTFMDDCGKKLGEEAKKKLDSINAERKKVRDTLDELKDSVRKPLTDWEKSEEDRVRAHQDLLADAAGEAGNMSNMWQTINIEEMTRVLEKTKSDKNRDWEEFSTEAAKVFDNAIEKIETAILRRKEYDDQQLELIKLREEKQRRDAEEELRLEKEREQARIKAELEAKARAEFDRKEQERANEERRLAREKQLAEEKSLAIQKEKDLAEKRLKEAAEKAERDKQLAIEKERKRVEDEKKAAADAEAKRQANLKHRSKINNEILASLKAQGLDEETGKKVITAIVSGMVPYTKISY